MGLKLTQTFKYHNSHVELGHKMFVGYKSVKIMYYVFEVKMPTYFIVALLFKVNWF